MNTTNTTSTIDELNDEYLPVLFKLPKINNDPFKENLMAKIIESDDYPLFSYGYHYFIHQNKDKMEVLEQFEGKKKVYRVMLPFETKVDNYDKDISTQIQKLLNISIVSRGFYKLWETLMVIPLLEKKENMKIGYLAEGPGSFIQCVYNMRNFYYNKKDDHFAITLKDKKNGTFTPEIDEKVKKNVKNLNVFNTTNKEDGDLINPKTINDFIKKFKIESSLDLVTADGAFEWKNENTQEQEIIPLVFAEIYGAMKLLKKKGHFILTMFETYTNISIKLLLLLRLCFENVYIHKPLTSKTSSSEKFIVCTGFLFDKKDKKKNIILSNFEKILTELYKNKKNNVIDIIPHYKIPTDFKTTILKMNNDISNRQILSINNITDFINGGNYFGQMYKDNNDKQINANSFWSDMFIAKQKELKKTTENIDKLYQELMDKNKNRIEKLIELLNE